MKYEAPTRQPSGDERRLNADSQDVVWSPPRLSKMVDPGLPTCWYTGPVTDTRDIATRLTTPPGGSTPLAAAAVDEDPREASRAIAKSCRLVFGGPRLFGRRIRDRALFDSMDGHSARSAGHHLWACHRGLVLGRRFQRPLYRCARRRAPLSAALVRRHRAGGGSTAWDVVPSPTQHERRDRRARASSR